MAGLAICGPGRSGKDVAAKTIADVLGVPYRQSTSEAATELVWREWGQHKIVGYRTAELGDGTQYKQRYNDAAEMFADRSNHRATWAKIIYSYNAPDGTRLYREMLEGGEFILCGVRRAMELKACQSAGLINLSIYIDRPGCADTTCEITAADCDLSILNHGTEEEFKARLVRIAKALGHICDEATKAG